jgi:uncharacterized membrane protein
LTPVLYNLVKLIHILLAITAVGFNASYAIWLMRSQRGPKELTDFALRGVKFLDDRIANPAYGLLLVTGLIMVFIGPWNLTTRWIDGALILWIILVSMAALGYTPALRNQIKALESDGVGSSSYEAAARRQNLFGIVVMIPVLLILFLMVFKPAV